MSERASTDAEEAIGQLVEWLSAAGVSHVAPSTGQLTLVAAPDLLVPDWVERCRLLQDATPTWWLMIEASPRTPRPTGGQLSVRLDPGRYIIETLAVDERRWLSRESAAGPRLVIGLFCPGRAAVLRIRPVSQEEP